MAPTTLIFDLDGTIWDSWPWLARVAGGGDANAERIALESLLDRGNAAKLLRCAGVTKSRFRRICEISDLEAYPGVLVTLEELRRRGTPLGVVTNLPSWIALPMLERLNLRRFFDTFVGWGRTTKRKPHPDPILAALSDLGVIPSPLAWYVGDSRADAEAACRAGVAFAWAAYGYGEDPGVASAKIASFEDVLGL